MTRHLTGLLLRLLPLLSVIAIAGCSRTAEYRIDGRVANSGIEWLNVTTYDGRSYVSRQVPLSDEGQFELRGSASSPVMMWVATDKHTVLTSFPVVDGDHIKLQADLTRATDSISLTGGEYAGTVGSFDLGTLDARRRSDIRAINEAVAEYIIANPASPVSPVLLTTRFHTPGSESRADSLLRLLDNQARLPALLGSYPSLLSTQLSTEATDPVIPMVLYDITDTVRRYVPAASTLSVLAVTPAAANGRDSVVQMIERLYDLLPRRRLQAVEFNTSTDSLTWANLLRNDSAKWLRTWHPARTASPALRPLAIPAVPFIIICDSTGTQLLRTRSVTQAEAYVRGYM